MILTWTSSPPDDIALLAQPQEYDALAPVDGLTLDALPTHRHPDREAIAGYLAFGRWSSGDMRFPEPVSPFVAEAIEDDALPVKVRPRGVTYAPRASPLGTRGATVRFDLPTDSTTGPVIAVVPSTIAQGHSASSSRVVIPTNAFVLDHGEAPSIRARLAIAVLFASDIEADVLEVEGVSVPPKEALRLSALLHTVNLGLTIAGG